MRIATWNVNSIRSRVDRVVEFLERSDIDVLALQETKCKDDQFPLMPIEAAGYEVAMHGLNQWNGVAVLSRLPIQEVQVGFPGMPGFPDPETLEARALGVTVEGTDGRPVTNWSLYVPNGREIGDAHYEYKLKWLDALADYSGQQLRTNPDLQMTLMGDWNIAPLDSDVWDISFFEGRTHVTKPERDAFAKFSAEGFQEVTRKLVDNYTYWDYQQLRFPKNEGMRIDFIYASPALANRVTGAEIDRNERKGKGASDHVPVIIELN